MAKKFYDGDPDYMDDVKWWELIEEEDRSLLINTPNHGIQEQDGDLEDFTDTDSEQQISSETETSDVSQEWVSPSRIQLALLSHEYRHDRSDQRWDVQAWQVGGSDPVLGDETAPWRLKATASGTYEFFVNTAHEAFRSSTLTPLDALLAELAWSAMDFLRGQQSNMSFGIILTDLRDRYAETTKLDPITLSGEAALTLSEMAKRVSEKLDAADGRALFDEFSPLEQEAVLQKMATRQLSNSQAEISAGKFLEYASRSSILRFFFRHPELFFDSRYWDINYSELDYGRQSVTEEAKEQLVRYYGSLISDAIWLADQDTDNLVEVQRTRLLRASLALELLAPSATHDESMRS